MKPAEKKILIAFRAEKWLWDRVKRTAALADRSASSWLRLILIEKTSQKYDDKKKA